MDVCSPFFFAPPADSKGISGFTLTFLGAMNRRRRFSPANPPLTIPSCAASKNVFLVTFVTLDKSNPKRGALLCKPIRTSINSKETTFFQEQCKLSAAVNLKQPRSFQIVQAKITHKSLAKTLKSVAHTKAPAYERAGKNQRFLTEGEIISKALAFNFCNA